MADIWPILAACAQGQEPSPQQWEALIAWEFQDPQRANAWGIQPDTARGQLEMRSHLLARLRPFQDQFPIPHADFSSLLPALWSLWLPLALQLHIAQTQLARPLIQGILGGQGTGKTTLTRILTLILAELGHSTVRLSIDDLYKTHAERLALRQQDPRLIWRGPPGTHDIGLGLTTLQRLKQPVVGQAVAIPRFDKSAYGGDGDRVAPEMVTDADIVLFEGWFVGARPVSEDRFDQPPSPIVSEADKAFAQDMNRALADYLPLWALLDRLIVLYPVDYRLSKQWRREAEQEMKATGKPGMSDEAIDQFVDYFWRALHPEIFIKPLVSHLQIVDLVIEIQPDHQPGAVYAPKKGAFH